MAPSEETSAELVALVHRTRGRGTIVVAALALA